MIVTRNVEAGGERLTLTLQTLELTTHSRLQKCPSMLQDILNKAVSDLVILLRQAEAAEKEGIVDTHA